MKYHLSMKDGRDTDYLQDIRPFLDIKDVPNAWDRYAHKRMIVRLVFARYCRKIIKEKYSNYIATISNEI